MTEKNKPEAKFTAGAVTATVWKNMSSQPQGEFSTVNLTRSYKDKSGNWQQTSTFRINDLPKANLVLQKAYDHLTTSRADA